MLRQAPCQAELTSFRRNGLFAAFEGHPEVIRGMRERALAHSTKCRDLFNGYYRQFAFGALADRSFVAGGIQ